MLKFRTLDTRHSTLEKPLANDPRVSSVQYPVSMSRLFSVILLVLFFAPSCAVVNHLDEALTLKEYSDEQDALAKMVKTRDKKFDEFLARVVSGDRLADLKRREDVLGQLGEPVLVTAIEEAGFKKERWLYTYQKFSQSSPKVYFVILSDGRVDHWYKIDPHPAPDPATNAPEKK
jgi:hypothetical protein